MKKTTGKPRKRDSVNDTRAAKGRLEKAIGAEKRALATVREVHARLVDAVKRLAAAKAQSTKEEKATRLVRAATKDLLAAKRKFRKAQRRCKRAAIQPSLQQADKASVAAASNRAGHSGRTHPPSATAVRTPLYARGRSSRPH